MKSQKNVLIVCILTSIAAAACAEVVPPRPCTVKVDCEEQEICSNNICVLDPCYDGMLSPDESDIDCGQACDVKCAENKKCTVDADCILKTCQDGVCVDPEKGCATANAGDLLITEILNNINTGKNFESFTPNSLQTEFIEIFNQSNQKLGLGKVEIQCSRTDVENEKKKTFTMKGCVEAKGAIVVSNTAIADLPEGVINLQTISGTGALTNTASYSCALVLNEYDENGHIQPKTLHTITVDGQAKAGISEVLEPMQYSSSARAMQLHSDANPDGAKHSPGYCTNGALYRNDCQTLCDNQVLDPGETDIDCGGSLCSPCKVDKKCITDNDCASGSCINNQCAFRSCTITGCSGAEVCDAASGECHSCTDNIKNGDENDIDCGGAVCGRCGEGKSCTDDAQCASFQCKSGRCSGAAVECKAPISGDILITEVFNYANSTERMESYDTTSEQKQAEFIELVNMSDHYVSLDNMRIELMRLDKDAKSEILLHGCIAPKQSAVVSNAAIKGLPKNTVSLVSADFSANFLVNTATYAVTLRNGDETLQTIHDVSAPTSGVSRIIPDLEHRDGDIALVNHTAQNAGLKHSPGYCTNGALYEDDCTILCEDGEQNGNESDVDCGGSCAKCGVGKTCKLASDCASNRCTNGVCDQPKCTSDAECPGGWCGKTTNICESCSDNIQNGDETDVDCGGLTCQPCDAGKKCQANVDCLSYACETFQCIGDPVESFSADEILINEIMGSPKSSTGTFFSTQPETKQCEFVEIVSLAKVKRNLNG